MTPAAPPGATPISVALEALWLTARMQPQVIAYNEVAAFRKRGACDVSALSDAFNALVGRHEVWHSVLDTDGGEPVLVTQPPARFSLDLVDLSTLAPEAAERQAVRLIAELARTPYDISRGPLLRPRLLRIAEDEHRLYLAMHHMVFDGVSLYRTLLPELITLYDALAAGREPALDPPPARYADYARWEREWIATSRAQRRLAYWRARLDGVAPARLPTDAARADVAAHRGGCLPVHLSAEAVAGLQDLARTGGGTPFHVFGALWAALMHRFSGETDIVFGAPADLRQRSEFTTVVGYCLTQVVLALDLSDDPTFVELVGRVRNAALDGLDHLVPFQRIVSELGPQPGTSANPVYQTMLVLEPTVSAPDPSWSLHLMDSLLSDAIGASKVDLELQLDEHSDGSVNGRLIYDRELFNLETVERLRRAWYDLVDAITREPALRVSDPELTSSQDRQALDEFNATTVWRTPATLVQRFAATVARHPGAPALSVGERTLTYGELRQMALRGAGALAARGVVPGDTVAVCLEPSLGLVGAALAALHAGAALLLLDPAGPADRRQARITAAGCAAVILADAELETDVVSEPADLPQLASGLAAVVAGDPEHDAGSVLSHAAVDGLASAFIGEIGLGPGQTVLTLPAMLYGSPATELWPALLAGARLVLARREATDSGADLSGLIRGEGVTHIHALAESWEALLESGLRSTRGLGVLVPAEGLTAVTAAALLERCRAVWTGYAPAATGAYCTLGRVQGTGPLSIGRPLANHRADVLDGHGRPVPVGFDGGLRISGPLVAGARRDSSAPVPDSAGTGAGLRTGRRARWLADGRLVLSDAT